MSNYSLYCDIPEGHNEYLIPMFSVPLLHLKIENWEEKKKTLLEMYSKRSDEREKFKVAEGSGSSLDVETDYHYTHDNIEENYDKEIANILDSELQTLADTLECGVELSTSWFEKATTNKFHQVHNHGATGYSAVCFIQFDPKHHSPTVFLNPDLTNMENGSFQPPGIRESSIIFFPSHILHYTAPNESEVDRIILSFNVISEYPCQKFEDEYDGCDEYCTNGV